MPIEVAVGMPGPVRPPWILVCAILKSFTTLLVSTEVSFTLAT